ncbi:MAG: RNA polymerase sigma factor FliA [Myxococcota bacterium]|nr:RNA polymerase sigma factor FliA [Myxococcota bacterium]
MSTQTARTPTGRREELILAHYPMVRKVAYRMVSRFPSCVEAEDLVTIGTLGLIDAVDRFEETRSISFSAYARIRVQGAILDELRKEDWIPRSVRNRHHKIQATRDDLREKLGRDPSHSELAAAMEVTTERLSEMIQNSTLRSLVSMEDSTGAGEEPIHSTLQSDDESPWDEAVQHDVSARVREALQSLPDRERQIVDLYYYRDLSFKEIGELLGVTESRISQLHSRLRNRLMSRLQDLMDDPMELLRAA